MAYVEPNFPSEKALKEAVKAGKPVYVLPGFLGRDGQQDGEMSVEGPHYPKPHSWYARVVVEGGKVIKVKS